MVAERARAHTAPQGAPRPANQVAFDMSGEVLLVACDDGTVQMFGVDAGEQQQQQQAPSAGLLEGGVVELAKLGQLVGHDGAVQALAVDPANGYVVTGGSDCTFRIWS